MRTFSSWRVSALSAIVVFLGVLLFTTAQASAEPRPGATTTGFDSALGVPRVVGWTFKANTAIRVTALGLWDQGNNGLSNPHDVGLFRGDGTLITSTTVPSGTEPHLAGGFRFVPITPLVLSADESFVVAAFMHETGESRDPEYGHTSGNSWAFDPAITFLEGRHTFPATGLVFPTSTGTLPRFGPNFLFEEVFTEHPIAVDAGWSVTSAVPPAFFWSGGDGSFSGDVFTFSSPGPTILRVTDDFCRGDRFRIFDNGVLVGDTSEVPIETGCSAAVGPDAAFANPDVHSSGSFNLGPGAHTIAIQAIVSPFGGGRGYIRVDSVPAPVADNDSYTTNEDTPLTVGAPGVLAGDVSALGALTAILVGVNGPGTVVLNSNGSFTYTPPANFNGTATFTYKANDGSTDSNVATVTITVLSVNDPPVADPETYLMDAGSTLTVPAPEGVLANDTDVDSEGLTAIVLSGPSDGTLTLNTTTGGFTYTPNEFFSGTDAFTYKANDGTADSNVATVTITVNDPGDQTAAVTNVAPTCEITLNLTFNQTSEDKFVIRPTDFLKSWHCRLFRSDTGEEVDPHSVHGAPGITIQLDADPAHGDLQFQPANTTLTFQARGSLCQQFPNLPDALYTAVCTAANFVTDPSERDPAGDCVDSGECLPAPIHTYVEDAPAFTIGVAGGTVTGDQCPGQNGNAANTGCPFALSVRVTLNGSPLIGVVVRVFDRNSAGFREVTGGDKNPPKSLYPTIYEADKGRVGACVTDAAGRCAAGLSFSFDAIAIVKFTNPTTGAPDYEGSPFGAAYKNGVVSKDMPIKR